MRYEEAIARAVERLSAAGIESAEIDARLLAQHVGLESSSTPSEELLSEFMQSVQRRCQREPLQHITGTMHFRFLELDATPGTFIVR
ncbi:MAG: peptide chain release factor N(5)-glutamine methyltransferase, partial [Actinomycetaceae bacterium]|nr:peptide chain release factor N(5)-glutamine methyltransferase [Actinomycetaceae bacterium]